MNEKLVLDKKIKKVYSCHDLRHTFAVNDYLVYNDILRTSRLLNHTSTNVTMVYLRALGFEVE